MKTKQQNRENMDALLSDIREFQAEKEDRKQTEIELSWELKAEYERDEDDRTIEAKHEYMAGTLNV